MDASMLEIGFKMSVALGVVLLTFGGAVFVTKKFFGHKIGLAGGKKSGQPRSAIEIEASRALGQGKTIHVIRCAGKVLVVGATAQNINVLSESEDLDAEVEEENFESSLRQQNEEERESSIRAQLGEKLREISRV